MYTVILKSGFIYFLSFLLSVTAQAQQTHFIFIQTENKQPFYIKMDNRAFSSSGSGYIIISGLTDSAYKLAIWFPDNEGFELNVTVDVKDTDLGFLLKNYNEGGWGMINLQSTELLVLQKSFVLIKEKEEKTSGNEFARILAAVVNDPAIAEVSVAKKVTETAINTHENKTIDIPVNDSSIAEVSVAEKITEIKTPENKTFDIPVNDSSIAEVNVAKKITEPATKVTVNKTIDIPVNNSSIAQVSAAEKITETVIKTPENKTIDIPINNSSIAQVSVAEKITETVIKTLENKTIDIPVNDSSIAEVSVAKKITEPATNVTENKTIDISVNDSSITEVSVAKKITETVIKITENKKTAIPVNKKVIPNSVSKKDIVDSMGTRFINRELQNPNAKKDSGSIKKDDFVIKEKKQTKQTELNSEKEVNLNCKKTATQSDFLKLRKQMAGQASEQNMIKAAYKQFATACYTTEQIKNLGVLFIVEEEKYKFYLAAFPYVTDRDNYGILKDQFTDNYYKTRFSAMMGN